MASYPDGVNPGQFLGTTQVFDLSSTDMNSEDFDVRLRHNFNNVVLGLNTRDSGYYAQEEFINGQLFYPDYSRVDSANSAPATYRQVYRKVIDTGTLPNTGTTNTAHGITVTSNFVFTRIYGCATDPVGLIGLPLPYASPVAANNIEVSVTATNVVITTGNNRAAFTKSHVVIEYCKY